MERVAQGRAWRDTPHTIGGSFDIKMVVENLGDAIIVDDKMAAAKKIVSVDK